MRASTWLTVAAICLASFWLEYALALRLDRAGVLAQADVLFDADASWYRASFAHGWGGRGPVHPNVSALVNPPIRAIAFLAGELGIAGVTERARRLELALLVAPVAAGLLPLVVFLALRRSGYRAHQALPIMVLAALSFTTVVFGSVPESFGLSALVLACALLLSARELLSAEARVLPWVMVAALAASLTSTNLVPLVLACGMTFFGVTGNRVRALLAAVTVGGLAALLVLGVALSADRMYQDNALASFIERVGASRSREAVNPRGGYFFTTPPAQRLADMPTALANTIAPASLIEARLRPDGSTGRSFEKGLSLEGGPAVFTAGNPLGTALVLAIGIGGVLAIRSGGVIAQVTKVALSVVSFNVLLHIFFGTELFLFSGHWLPAVLVLVAGIARLDQWHRVPTGTVILWGAVVAVGITNATHVMELLGWVAANEPHQ